MNEVRMFWGPPVTVDAVQWDGTPETSKAINVWLNREDATDPARGILRITDLAVGTLIKELTVGDWIVLQGVTWRRVSVYTDEGFREHFMVVPKPGAGTTTAESIASILAMGRPDGIALAAKGIELVVNDYKHRLTAMAGAAREAMRFIVLAGHAGDDVRVLEPQLRQAREALEKGLDELAKDDLVAPDLDAVRKAAAEQELGRT